jgi:alpha-glucosidase
MKRILSVCLVLTCSSQIALAIDIQSPNGAITVSFDVSDMGTRNACPVYRVTYRGEPVVESSSLGFELDNGTWLGQGVRILATETTHHDSIWKPVYGERSTVRNRYTQCVVTLAQGSGPAYSYDLTLRCYDEGVAFCTTFHADGNRDHVTILKEQTQFQFSRDHTVWATNSAQGKYRKTTLSQMGSGIERPLTIMVDDTTYISLAEARLVDYARMKLATSQNCAYCLVSQLSSEVQSPLPMTTPWRVIMIADSPGRLLENNDILLNLNEPCAIEDTSWIKPGKVIREVTLTTVGGKACVDFAVKHKLQYVEFDAGWYGHEYENDSDATTITVDPKRSPGPLDLHEIIRYARQRDIGIIVYVNRRALDRQLDEILPLYKRWGIKGVKYGFVNVGSQQWTSWLHRAIRMAAEHQLMVDVHDEYRPTGYSRTYPNFMTQEGIAGDETKPSNALTLTILFTRMLAGAGDNTICYYDGRVDENATHAYQLAKAVCIYSPWQFLYWYDRPPTSPQKKGGAGGEKGNIGVEPELEFFDHVPTVWDDTRVIHGIIGEYAVIARRSGMNWFVGGMNSGRSRTLKVPLDFLTPNKPYTAYIYSDDATVDTRTGVRIDHIDVNSQTVLNMSMGKQGGQAIRIFESE